MTMEYIVTMIVIIEWNEYLILQLPCHIQYIKKPVIKKNCILSYEFNSKYIVYGLQLLHNV